MYLFTCAALRRLALIPLSLAAGLPLAAQTVPSTINYQGRLTDNGTTPAPITATVNMSFEIWDVQSGGVTGTDRLWLEPASGTVPVQVTGGIFSILLGGNGVPLPASLFSSGTSRYLQIIANGETLTPRQTLGATGYADQAQNAAQAVQATNADYATVSGSANNSAALGSVSAANYQTATNLSCSAGSFINTISSSGGSATCASASGALVPPVTLSAASASPILSATNSGTGRAGSFTVSNPASAATTLAVLQQGTGSAVTVNSPTSANASPVMSLNGSGTGTILSVLNTGTGGGGGYFEVTGGGNPTPVLIAKTNAPAGNALQAFTGNAAGVPVYINGASGQTANLTEWRNSGGTLQGWVDNLGGLHSSGAGGVIGISHTGAGGAATFTNNDPAVTLLSSNTGSGQAGQFQSSGVGPALGAIASGAGGLSLRAQAGAASVIPLAAVGAASQTANLQEWRDNSATALSWVDSAGGFHGNGAGLTGVTASALTPPVTLSASNTFPILSGTNSGSGNGLSGVTVSASGVYGGSTGIGTGVYGTSSSGNAGDFEITNSANTNPSLYARSVAGEAADFSVTDTLTTSDALHVTHAGRGNVIYANKSGSSGTGAGVRAIAAGGLTAVWSTSSSGYGLYAESTSGNGATGVTSSGRGVVGTSQTNYGVVGQSGTGAAGLAINAFGVAGINTNSGDEGFLGGATTGVYGLASGASNHVGVYGIADGGATAVLGTIPIGATGYAGSFSNNNGGNALPALTVNTASPTAALQVAAASSTDTALEITSGTIKVTGAGVNTTTPVFIHQATAPSSNITCINNPLTNNAPTAILIVTQNWSPPSNSGVYNGHPIGVYYAAPKWCIFNEDLAAMPLNAAFNVMVIKP